LGLGVGDDRVRGIRGNIRAVGVAVAADEAPEVVLVTAVVNAPVLVLALEGVRPDVLLAEKQRVAGAVADAGERGLALPGQQERARSAVVEVVARAQGLAVPDPLGVGNPQGPVVVGGPGTAGVIGEAAGPGAERRTVAGIERIGGAQSLAG